jgi:hypothetical protein
MIAKKSFLVLLMLLTACAVAHTSPTTAPTTPPSEPNPDIAIWREMTKPLGGEQIPSKESFAVIVPRTDIDLESEMGQVPITAGIASKFYFFRCPCGKIKTLGELVICDYESDDVIDALRAGKFTVVSISPLLQSTRPTIVSVRFQAEGDGDDLVKTLREALDQTGRRTPATRPD